MRSLRRFLCFAALVAALPLYAGVRGVLQEPRDGAILRGGMTATVAWAAEERLPSHAEEWEAFLSADGGRTWAYRITPHLDLSRRAFTFDVPNVETENARILIRAGDERDEFEIDLRGTFAIRQDRVRAMAEVPAAVVESERGEAARAGEPGVVQWVDGDREGGHLEVRSALQHERVLHAAPAKEAVIDCAEGATYAPTLDTGDGAAVLVSNEPAPIRDAASGRAGRDVLHAQSRLNI